MRDFDGGDCGCVTPVANVALSLHLSLHLSIVTSMVTSATSPRRSRRTHLQVLAHLA
jgi:hypothetical protein